MARDPFDEIERMFDQLSSQFEQFDPSEALSGNLVVDVLDTGGAFEVVANLPGFAREDVEVTLPDEKSVRISATRESGTDEGSDDDEDEVVRRYVRRERHRQSVSRTVSLPDRVDPEETTATLENGVLTVTLPKAEEEDGTEIEVN